MKVAPTFYSTGVMVFEKYGPVVQKNLTYARVEKTPTMYI